RWRRSRGMSLAELRAITPTQGSTSPGSGSPVTAAPSNSPKRAPLTMEPIGESDMDGLDAAGGETAAEVAATPAPAPAAAAGSTSSWFSWRRSTSAAPTDAPAAVSISAAPAPAAAEGGSALGQRLASVVSKRVSLAAAAAAPPTAAVASIASLASSAVFGTAAAVAAAVAKPDAADSSAPGSTAAPAADDDDSQPVVTADVSADGDLVLTGPATGQDLIAAAEPDAAALVSADEALRNAWARAALAGADDSDAGSGGSPVVSAAAGPASSSDGTADGEPVFFDGTEAEQYEDDEDAAAAREILASAQDFDEYLKWGRLAVDAADTLRQILPDADLVVDRAALHAIQWSFPGGIASLYDAGILRLRVAEDIDVSALAEYEASTSTSKLSG
ncbi:hypothetical protein HK405_015042, partial [Cladochytrium tenue]